MPRADLLALDTDELASMTNRGTVKRALRELESGALTFSIEETEVELCVTWSDGIHCTFPQGKAVPDAICSSGSSGISRHVVRSVLAYQRFTKSGSAKGGDPSCGDAAAHEETESAPSVSWDPGTITDEELQKHFSKAAITRARKLFQKGVLADLTRGRKPSVKFLHDSCTIRFPVAGDLRYATGDCEEKQLSRWVPQAVWAFRELAEERTSGLVVTGDGKIDLPQKAIDHLWKLMDELCQTGIANLSGPWLQRFSRVENEMMEAGLVWLGSLCEAIQLQLRSYREQDSRFDPVELSRLIGELSARLRVVQNEATTIPLALVCGTKSSARTAFKRSRLVALGLDARPTETQVEFRIYFQDSETGTVLVLSRHLAAREGEGEPAKSFDDLAQRVLSSRASIEKFSRSILLLASGKRTPTDDLILPAGSGKVAVNAQEYLWEDLKPPFAAESFEQIRQRLEMLPPDWLRPRRCAENLHLIHIRRIGEVEFDNRMQRLVATIEDREGQLAKMMFPFHEQGRAGFEQFFEALATRGEEAKFVCGHLRLENRQLIIEPVSVVFEHEGQRSMLVPWLKGAEAAGAGDQRMDANEFEAEHPIDGFLDQLASQIADVLIVGWDRQDAEQWHLLLENGRAIGFDKILKPLEQIVTELQNRRQRVNQNVVQGPKSLMELCIYLRLIA